MPTPTASAVANSTQSGSSSIPAEPCCHTVSARQISNPAPIATATLPEQTVEYAPDPHQLITATGASWGWAACSQLNGRPDAGYYLEVNVKPHHMYRLRAWVKTDLSGSADTTIYMYYGNAAATWVVLGDLYLLAGRTEPALDALAKASVFLFKLRDPGRVHQSTVFVPRRELL